MIIPGRPMLRLLAFTMLPASLLAAVMPQHGDMFTLIPPALAILALADLIPMLRRRNRMVVTMPPSLTMVTGRETPLYVTLGTRDGAAISVEFGIPMPEGIVSEHSVQHISIPAGEERIRISWPLTARKRGVFSIASCNARINSPLRLWQIQVALPVDSTLKAYPCLRQERRRLAALFLERNERQVRSQRQRGQGREFEKLRQYQPGDCMGDIHWRATAKRGQLITKEFQIEKTQEIYLLMDRSRLSGRLVPLADGGMEPFIEQSIRTAMILGSVANMQGDLFGVAAFGNGISGFVKARGGRHHLGRCMEMLYSLEPAQGNPSYGELCAFLAARLKRRALLVFIAPLDEPALAEEFKAAITLLARRHLVCVAMPVPAAASPLFSEPVEDSGQIYERLAGHMVWHGLLELQQSLRLKGIRLFLVKNERLSADIISHYLDVKRRQQL